MTPELQKTLAELARVQAERDALRMGVSRLMRAAGSHLDAFPEAQELALLLPVMLIPQDPALDALEDEAFRVAEAEREPEMPARAIVDDFHAHLDRCAQCARNPFSLCDEGQRLILRVTGGS